MKDWDRVIGWSVLKHDYEATVAKAFRILLISNVTVMKQASSISFGEVRAALREHIVGFVKLMR